jgi:hypothetical protein
VLSAIGLARAVFSPARRGADFVALGAVVGTRVSYTLSEPASTRFTVMRLVHRRGGRRYVKLRGGFTHQGVAGMNRLKFRGRLRRRALRPGAYRLVAVATDLVGNRSAPVIRAFRIK